MSSPIDAFHLDLVISRPYGTELKNVIQFDFESIINGYKLLFFSCFDCNLQFQAANFRQSRVVMMAAHNQLSVNNSSQIRSLMPRSKNKVFEDASSGSGIVCYRDENGEITCEGFDEGPRFHPPFSRFTCNSRDVQIVQLLQRCWDGEALPGRKGI